MTKSVVSPASLSLASEWELSSLKEPIIYNELNSLPCILKEISYKPALGELRKSFHKSLSVFI